MERQLNHFSKEMAIIPLSFQFLIWTIGEMWRQQTEGKWLFPTLFLSVHLIDDGFWRLFSFSDLWEIGRFQEAIISYTLCSNNIDYWVKSRWQPQNPPSFRNHRRKWSPITFQTRKWFQTVSIQYLHRSKSTGGSKFLPRKYTWKYVCFWILFNIGCIADIL